MKKTLRVLSLLLAISLLATVFGIMSITAASENGSEGESALAQKKAQKVVAVVFDDSGSMNSNIYNKDSAASPTRADYALYSIKMLMSLLGEGDILTIVPMNKSPKSYTLVGDARQDQIDKIVGTGIFKASGSTPISSIDTALNQLVAEGLMDAENLPMQDENKDFWLFVLTDGAFGGVSEKNTPKEVRQRIDEYPTLKTIYFAFSEAAVDLRNTEFESELSTAYQAGDGDELVAGMQDVASQLSGRYTYTDFNLNGDPNATSGDTVEINLNSCPFPIKNLSILALNCGATLKSVKYQPKDASSATELPAGSITQTCVIAPGDIPKLLAGYSAVINGSPYLSGGKLILKFSKSVSKEYISIFAEPALILSPTFKVDDGTGKYTTVDSDYITGGKVSIGQKLMVGYKCVTADGSSIDLASAFKSNIKASVTYSGVAKAIPSGSTETDITLVGGPNTITVTVNVEGVNYKMYTSVNCNILEDQSSYKVEATHDAEAFSNNGNSVASYKVFVDHQEKTPAQLKADGFNWYVEITSPDGDVVRVDNPEIDGKIAHKITAKSGIEGEYKVYFRVISTLGWRMDETMYSYAVDLEAVEIRTTSPENLNKGTKEARAEFTVHYGESQLDKAALQNYDVKLKLKSYDNTESEVAPTIDADGKISVTVPFNPYVYGAYDVTLSVSSNVTGDVKEYTHTFKVYPSSVVIKGEHPDSFEQGNTKTTAKYWITVDGVKFNKAELDKYNWSLKTYVPGGDSEYGNTVTVDEDGTIHLEYDVAGGAFGAYESRVELVFSDSYVETYSNFVKNIPESISVNVVGGQKLSISQYQMTINDKPVQFELYSNPLPLVFNNGITEFKLMVGNVDVTQYAVISGNVLSYAPHADHFGGALPIGEHTVTIQVYSVEIPALKSDASTSFDVTKTLYEIISLKDTNKKVERFSLKNMDVALQFQVLRDGVPLPLDELAAAYEAGEIKVVDQKGTFTWEFWLPCGREITVKDVDGQPVLEFRVTRDISFLGLDKVMGMFFFTGDKPISVSYRDASLVDNIKMERGAVWIYLLVWFIIFFIIHVILFAIGFINGKCKNLPTGTFVYVSFAGGDSKMVALNTDNDINTTFADKWSWHLGRFFLYGCFKEKKLWYHQPGKSIPYEGVIKYNADGRLGVCFDASNIYKGEQNSSLAKPDRIYRSYKNALAKDEASSSEKLEVRLWRNYFKMKEKVAVKSSDFLSYTGVYIECKKDKTPKKAIIFVKTR